AATWILLFALHVALPFCLHRHLPVRWCQHLHVDQGGRGRALSAPPNPTQGTGPAGEILRAPSRASRPSSSLAWRPAPRAASYFASVPRYSSMTFGSLRSSRPLAV